jgi:hypothetical protein
MPGQIARIDVDVLIWSCRPAWLRPPRRRQWPPVRNVGLDIEPVPRWAPDFANIGEGSADPSISRSAVMATNGESADGTRVILGCGDIAVATARRSWVGAGKEPHPLCGSLQLDAASHTSEGCAPAQPVSSATLRPDPAMLGVGDARGLNINGV